MSRLKEALEIIKDTDYDKGIHAVQFAKEFWPNSNMHITVKNTGNGACHGKAAWLCAGSYIGKLIKKKLVRHADNFRGYYITSEGKRVLKELQDGSNKV